VTSGQRTRHRRLLALASFDRRCRQCRKDATKARPDLAHRRVSMATRSTNRVGARQKPEKPWIVKRGKRSVLRSRTSGKMRIRSVLCFCLRAKKPAGMAENRLTLVKLRASYCHRYSKAGWFNLHCHFQGTSQSEHHFRPEASCMTLIVMMSKMRSLNDRGFSMQILRGS